MCRAYLSVVRGISAVTEAYPFVRVVGGMTDGAGNVGMGRCGSAISASNLVDGSFGPAGDDGGSYCRAARLALRAQRSAGHGRHDHRDDGESN